jgi:hypothetical protein
MKKPNSKTDFLDRAVPDTLADMPRFAFTPSYANSPQQSKRTDIKFNVRSSKDLVDAIRNGFADPATAPTPPQPLKK